jgi:hypothetical protein
VLRKKNFITGLLFATVLLFVFPPPLLHGLSCHADTVDRHQCGSEEPVVETQHHHCEVLQLFFSPFQPEQKSFAITPFQFPFDGNPFITAFDSDGFYFHDRSRSPPAIS